MSEPIPALFDFFQSLNLSMDVEDHDKRTPFLLVCKNYNKHNKYKEAAFEKLISGRVRLDKPDVKGRTAFLELYALRDFEAAYRLLDKRANINQIDN